MSALPMSKPWYREPWVWFVIGLPLTAVVASFVTLALALRSNDGVVADDYYKRGLAINEQLARSGEAVRLGLVAAIDLEGVQPQDRIRLRLSGQQAVPVEASIKLRLVNPGRSSGDRVAVLARTGEGDALNAEYVGAWGDATPVSDRIAWRVVIEGQSWRIDGDAGAVAGPASLRVAAVKPQ